MPTMTLKSSFEEVHHVAAIPSANKYELKRRLEERKGPFGAKYGLLPSPKGAKMSHKKAEIHTPRGTLQCGGDITPYT